MAEQLKAGDLVQLKTGISPTMVVDWVSDELGTLIAGCTWFDTDKKRQFEKFPVTSLTLLG
jgi:uncharacterized protein YodC (DUF2158 family)